MTTPLSPNMAFSWATMPFVSPTQPQNTTLPTWGAVGSPSYPHATFNPNAPVSLARTVAGFSGLGSVWGMQNASSPQAFAVAVAGTAAAGALAYHGYKRNRGSVGWALMWFFFGGIFWPITLPVALAQGFGKPGR